MRIVCQQTILMKYHAFFVIFEKKAKFKVVVWWRFIGLTISKFSPQACHIPISRPSKWFERPWKTCNQTWCHQVKSEYSPYLKGFLTLSTQCIYIYIYTMHNIFSNFLCFTSTFAQLGAVLNTFNDNDQNSIFGKWNHELTDAIFSISICWEQLLQRGSKNKIHIRC